MHRQITMSMNDEDLKPGISEENKLATEKELVKRLFSKIPFYDMVLQYKVSLSCIES